MTDQEGSEFQPLTNDNFDSLSDFLDHAEGLATAHIKKKIKDIPKVVLSINRVPESSLLFDSNDLIPPPKSVEKELETEKEQNNWSHRLRSPALSFKITKPCTNFN